MRRVLVGLVLVVVVTMGVLPTRPVPGASACSCAMTSLQDRVDDADVVLRGVVTAVDHPWWRWSSATPMTYTVAVTHVWRGGDEGSVTATTAGEEASCGLPGLTEGQDVIIAGRAEHGAVAIGLCGASGTATPERVAAVIEVLGEGNPVTPETGRPGPSTPVLVGVGAGIVLLGVGVVVVVRRRRSR